MSVASCPPFSPCFCEQHPKVKQCQAIDLDIDLYLPILLIVAIILACNKLKKYKP